MPAVVKELRRDEAENEKRDSHDQRDDFENFDSTLYRVLVGIPVDDGMQ